MVDARATLARLIAERGDDYAAISRLIGRNASYIQQYIGRGSPRILAERDRRIIARYFGVDERMLGAPDSGVQTGKPAMQIVPRYDVGASAGGGNIAGDEHVAGALGFEADWLREHGWARSELGLLRVEGDSMEPTLSHGDELLVETAVELGREGVHVIRMDGALMVKRIARAPGGGYSIRSDNSAYPSWENVSPESVTIVGRVLWVGRVL